MMASGEITDRLIAEALREGRMEAYEMIFRQWYQPLCRFAHTLLPDPDEAEEVVQNVFVALWEKRTTIAIEGSVKAYIYRSVRNQCYNVLEHHRVRREHADHTLHLPSGAAPSAAEVLHGSELEQHIARAMQALPEQCRIVFEMSRFGDMSYAEIAAELDISVKTVENHIGKALRILRGELADYLPVLLLLTAPWT